MRHGTLSVLMHILFLDLASNGQTPDEGACIACVSEEQTIAIRFADHRLGDDAVMPLLDAVLQDAGWTDADITHIACTTGPGGFTSLRMAVTLANVLADQLRVPLAGVRLDQLYAARVTDVDWLWIHATKKRELFVRGFGVHADRWPDATLTPLDDLAAAGIAGVPFAGELLPEQRAILSPSDAPLAPLNDALPRALRSLPYTHESVAAWYGRGW